MVAGLRVVVSESVGITVTAKLSLPARTGPDRVVGATASMVAVVVMMTPGPPV